MNHLLGKLKTLARSRLMGLAVLLMLPACSHAVPLSPAITPSQAQAQVPLNVGVLYTPELTEYEHRGGKMGDTWIFPLGSASVELLDQTWGQAFRSALPVGSRPPLASGSRNLAAVIEPRIEAFDFHLPMIKTGTYTAEITYRFVLYALSGDPVASWTVTGEGAQRGQFGFDFSRWPGEAADLAMEDAAQKFVAGLKRIPEVRRWLRSKGALIAQVLPWVSTDE